MDGPSLIYLDTSSVEFPDAIMSQIEAQEYIDTEFFEDENNEEWNEQWDDQRQEVAAA